MEKQVTQAERLTGHYVADHYPPIGIYDCIGAGNGSLICSIQSFHYCDVEVTGIKTTLVFEGKTRLEISDGIITYQ